MPASPQNGCLRSAPPKPGSRPTRRTYCAWAFAAPYWTEAEQDAARSKAQTAYDSRSATAQYAALGELRVLDLAAALRAGEVGHKIGSQCYCRCHSPA